MSAPKKTFVLVHGGGHGGWCWGRVAPLLRAAGHEVHTPTLTGLGERSHLLSPEVSLETHVADVANVLAYEDLTDVVLVGHSYGGLVITGVADRAPERVGHLVSLDAAIPRDGECLADSSPGVRRFAEADMRLVDGVFLVLWPGPIAKALYGVVDPADLAWMEPRLTPHPYRTFTDPLVLRNEAAVAAIPRTIINCPGTLAVRPPETLDRWFAAERVWALDTGHDTMITAPAATAELLLRLV
jgi:pimeloyl-ACP methyl ester carboxylesterase